MLLLLLALGKVILQPSSAAYLPWFTSQDSVLLSFELKYPLWGRHNVGGVELPADIINVSWLAILCECHSFTGDLLHLLNQCFSQSPDLNWAYWSYVFLLKKRCQSWMTKMCFCSVSLCRGKARRITSSSVWFMTLLLGSLFSTLFVCLPLTLFVS